MRSRANQRRNKRSSDSHMMSIEEVMQEVEQGTIAQGVADVGSYRLASWPSCTIREHSSRDAPLLQAEGADDASSAITVLTETTEEPDHSDAEESFPSRPSRSS